MGDLGGCYGFMSVKVGRNKPCPCGSGKKFKYCCARAEQPQPPKNRSTLWLVSFAIGCVVIVAAFMTNTPTDPLSNSSVPMPSRPLTPTGGLTPQPPGPVPPGKVWSPEHGHWHDVAGTPTESPTRLVSPPPGPAPAGKVWSPEHGHWHDAP